MSTYEYAETQEMREAEGTAKQKHTTDKPVVVKVVSVLLYIMAVVFVLAVLGGKAMAVIFIPLVVYLAYGLSGLKASARRGTIAFACFGLVVNLGAYLYSNLTMHAVLLDVAIYSVILTLLFMSSARKANWMK